MGAIFFQCNSWRMFAVVVVSQMLLSWLYHPLRSTNWYYSCVRHMSKDDTLGVVLRTLLLCQSNVSARDWACFVGLEMALEASASLYSAIVFAVGYAWLVYGYNGPVIGI